MLQAVLRTELQDLVILNPELPGDLSESKQVASTSSSWAVRYSSHFELHLLQLAKLSQDGHDSQETDVERWARFLTNAQQPAELKRLAKESPMMARAKEALEELSDDWLARRAG